MNSIKLGGRNMFPIAPEVQIVDESFIAQYERLHALLKMVTVYGRSVNFGLSADGFWHLRRRAKQVKREFAMGFHLSAPRAEERNRPAIRTHVHLDEMFWGIK